jgi:hypothetical protein
MTWYLNYVSYYPARLSDMVIHSFTFRTRTQCVTRKSNIHFIDNYLEIISLAI